MEGCPTSACSRPAFGRTLIGKPLTNREGKSGYFKSYH